MFTDEFLFAQALNIEEPMYIKIEYLKEVGELHIYIDSIKGSMSVVKFNWFFLE